MAALKILSLKSLLKFDFQILCIELHADHAIPFLVRKSFSEDEMYEPRYTSETIFRSVLFRVWMIKSLSEVHMLTNSVLVSLR